MPSGAGNPTSSRPDQALRLSLHRAQSRRVLSRAAQFARQPQPQPAADAALPAREDRGADRPWLCQGERRAAVAIVHNVVGLLHATMGIYYAYIDRAPVFVIGATGPMDEGKRRPRVDWDPHRQCPGQCGARLRQMGLPARRHPGRAGQLRPRLFDHDERAAGPDLHVLRRRLQEAPLTTDSRAARSYGDARAPERSRRT